MTLDLALKCLSEVAEEITITYGAHTYRESFSPHYKWEVIAGARGQGYPPFDQSDDLFECVLYVLHWIEQGTPPDRDTIRKHIEEEGGSSTPV